MEDAYYSMIYFPAAASFESSKNAFIFREKPSLCFAGKAVANVYGKMAEDCIEKDQILAK